MTPLRTTKALILMTVVAAGCTGQGGDDTTERARSAQEHDSKPAATGFDTAGWNPLADFPELTVPADNPMTDAKVALGKQLYYDARLSGDGSRSCYKCHLCEKGLTDGIPTAVGAFKKQLTRSSPTMWNVGYHDSFYWDGRAPTLEKQVLAAWSGGNMGADPDKTVKLLNEIAGYRSQFQSIFGSDATPEHVVQAIASYVRTITCATTPYDRWRAGDTSAIDAAAVRGHALFIDKAGCAQCHTEPLFTDLKFHNVGIGLDADTPDVGRFKVTKAESDYGAFKTPTLRDIVRSAPYFHDGSVASLAEAVQFMLGGGHRNPAIDPLLKKVALTPEEFGDLLSFLGTLECECDSEPPRIP